MKKLICILSLIGFIHVSYAQLPEAYQKKIIKAFDLKLQKKYDQAAGMYEEAFAVLGGRGAIPDKINAARVYAVLNKNDQAFEQLLRVVEVAKYDNADELQNDKELGNLQSDARWAVLLSKARANKEAADKVRNNPLTILLEQICDADQGVRKEMQEMVKKHGAASQDPELKDLADKMRDIDAANAKKVDSILQKHGWIPETEIGGKANLALFLVIQHSFDLLAKYSSHFKTWFEEKKLKPQYYAYFEDRSLLMNGKKQRYGTQLAPGPDGKMMLSPLEDEAKVDERRKQVGLSPLAEYLEQVGIKQ